MIDVSEVIRPFFNWIDLKKTVEVQNFCAAGPSVLPSIKGKSIKMEDIIDHFKNFHF